MSDQSPILVPLTVEALAVNDTFRTGGNVFVRSQMQYAAMLQVKSGQGGLSANDTNFTSSGEVSPSNETASDYYNGVYVKWRLPRALTQGAQDSVSGQTQYPQVPNRWVVVRYAGDLGTRAATAWLIESDYVWTTNPVAQNASQVGAIYVVPAPVNGVTQPVAEYIGRNVLLGSWTESGQSLGLTAMGPGNPAFAIYQPQNNNVFSFIDALNGEDAQTLSYQVFGWYSNGDGDPFTGATQETFPGILAALGWNLLPGTDSTAFATWTLFSGSVNGVQWQNDSLPPGGAPNGTPVSIAAGNTSVEALTALITAQAAGANVEPELLEAFQLDMIDVLDEPDGAAKLADKLQASFFQRFGGGYTWTIVDAPNTTTPVSASELAKEEDWLAALATAQQTLDNDLRTLASLQAQLYVAWWKFTSWPWAYQNSAYDPTFTKQQNFQDLLDPTIENSVAWQVAQQQTTVQADLENVPTGATPDTLQAAIDAYAAANDLPSTRVLKRGAAPTFYLPNNPVVLIAGAGASGIVSTPSSLTCRFPSQLVTGFTYDDGTIDVQALGDAIPQPDFSDVSGVPWSTDLATQLVQEFFLLDPDNAATVATAIGSTDVTGIAAAMASPSNDLPSGSYPAGGVTAWTQNPWHPLLLIWAATYYPIAYGTTDSPNWTFDNGQYIWNTSSSSVGSTLGPNGLIQLTPAAAFNMEARLEAFLANNPNLPADELAAFQSLLTFVQSSDNWDLLSQSLDGFNDQLCLGMPGVFVAPASTTFASTPPLTTLLDSVGSYPPALGNIPTTVPTGSLFQPWRAGQFTFGTLIVVDEWGQALWPIDQQSSRTETVFLPDDLSPVLTSTSATLTVTSAAAESVPPPSADGGSAEPAAAPTPAITSLTPNLLQAGMAPTALVPMTVDGSNFGADAIVAWNDAPLTTTVVSATELLADIPAQLLAAPGTASVTVTSGGATSAAVAFTISAGAAIGSLSPSSVTAGSSSFTLTLTGVGFSPFSIVSAGPAGSAATALATTFVSDTQLTATVPATLIAGAGSLVVSESVGASVIPNASETFVQLPPALLQPARLDFDLISASNDTVPFGPANPGANPVCGWVLPNHLDAALMAYDPSGAALGEMTIGIPTSGTAEICWTNAPGSPYTSLAEIAAALPHFGPFLLALSQQDTSTFTAFLDAIDETLWTTVPMGAVFDASLAVLVGRPLAMVRARVAFELDGPANPDPSWQYTFTAETPAITGYEFAIELGNIARLDDGLIGYFVGDDYTTFNVVQQAGATGGSYLQPIGANDNYLYLPPDNETASFVSMLVDPRAPVHATTAILPTASVSLPMSFVDAALAAMNITIRVDGILTDQRIAAPGGAAATTLLMPTPQEQRGTWSWLENDGGTWTSYAIAPNDTTARLSTVAPVLRRGLLQLSSAFGTTAISGRRRPKPTTRRP